MSGADTPVDCMSAQAGVPRLLKRDHPVMSAQIVIDHIKGRRCTRSNGSVVSDLCASRSDGRA